MKKADSLFEVEPKDLFNPKVFKKRRIVPSSILKAPRTRKFPPLSTLPLKVQMDLTSNIPESIITKLKGHRPNMALKSKGVPSKIILSPYNIEDIQLVSTYIVVKALGDESKHFLELFVPNEMQAFWLMAMVFKPNQPYLTIITSEGNSLSSSLMAAYLIKYYSLLSGGQSGELIRWYRSLEFVPLKQIVDDPGAVVVQCRHPSWVDSEIKFLHSLHNVRAAYENSTLILLVAEEDLGVIPHILSEEPYGVLLKFALKADSLPKYATRKRRNPILSKIMKKIKE